jgi:hypothetical protein
LSSICGRDKKYFFFFTAYRLTLGPARLPIKYVKKKGKAIPLQAWTGPQGSRRLRFPEFQENRHMKMVSLSALRTGRLYHQEMFLVFILLEAESTPMTPPGIETATFHLVA